MRIACFVTVVSLAAFVSNPVSAEIYRYVDESGNVIFSDQKREGAQEMQLPELSTYGAPKTAAPGAANGAAADAEVAYTAFSIASPTNEETIRENTGSLVVQFAVEPALKPGHRFRATVAGQTQEGTASVEFKNLDRGSHNISAELVDDQGNTLMRATPVTVHMHRYSKLLAPNVSPPPPPPTTN